MASTAMEKTAEELRKEIEELHRQQREITERLRDPRGIRRGGLAGIGPRNFGANGGRGFGRTGPQRGFVRQGESIDPEDQPTPKRRLLSAVVKVEDGELAEEGRTKETQEEEPKKEDLQMGGRDDEQRENARRGFGGFRRDANQRVPRVGNDIPTGEPVPRVLPKDEDPTLVNRNKRMLNRLLGTLTKFQEEDKHLSSTEAYMRRSDSLKRAEERAREESEKLRQQEREELAEKRRRDLTLRARVAAKAEEKKLELVFLRWAEHHNKLCNFLRTKAEPPIFYMPAKPLEDDASSTEQRKEKELLEWKARRREELTEYQKQLTENYLANVEAELERWQNARNAWKANNKANLQETMDQELETHRQAHGPKTSKIPRGDDNEEDVEDDVGEDDMMDDVLVVDDNGIRRVDEEVETEAGKISPSPEERN
ncbi:Pinin protein [Nymphaea thermarum]|nr:Pinin protein [Nymphaea thermarum]